MRACTFDGDRKAQRAPRIVRELARRKRNRSRDVQLRIAQERVPERVPTVRVAREGDVIRWLVHVSHIMVMALRSKSAAGRAA
jgi:hypothetical protein